MPSTKLRLALAAAALMVAGAAQAAPELVSINKDAMHGSPRLFGHLAPSQFISPKIPVYDSVTVPRNTETFIDGWALIDTSTCTQLGMPQPFTIHADKDDKLVYTSSLIKAKIGSGACHGQKFIFAGISVTWPGSGASGATHYNHFGSINDHIQKNSFGLPHRVEILDFITVTAQ